MSMHDPISDMLTIIRNSQLANKISVNIPSSNFKVSITKVLKQEGYISDYIIQSKNNKSVLKIFLKYYQGKSVIEEIVRISKPSLRIYRKKDNLPIVLDGLGIAIISTSQGVMSNKQANKLGLGGEIICIVS